MDLQALKFLLEQKVGTIAQQKWVTKLMGYNFRIKYKKGKENKVADTLSRKYEPEPQPEGVLAVISFPTSDWIHELKMSYSNSPELGDILSKL